jgi:hypothetical protein
MGQEARMANYNDMCNAARNAQLQTYTRKERAFASFSRILQGLITYCGVPQEAITFLKWNGEGEENRRYLPAEDGQLYSMQAATQFDDSDKYWHLGVRIRLSQLQFVTFALCVGDEDGTLKVKAGDRGKPQNLALDSDTEIKVLCDSIAEAVIQVYSDPKNSAMKDVGFSPNS